MSKECEEFNMERVRLRQQIQTAPQSVVGRVARQKVHNNVSCMPTLTPKTLPKRTKKTRVRVASTCLAKLGRNGVPCCRMSFQSVMSQHTTNGLHTGHVHEREQFGAGKIKKFVREAFHFRLRLDESSTQKNRDSFTLQKSKSTCEHLCSGKPSPCSLYRSAQQLGGVPHTTKVFGL